MLDHLRVVVRRDERLAFAAVGHRQPADEVGQPDIRRALLLRVLVEVVVELPRLVADPQVVLLIAHEIVEDHEVREQDLVHPPDRLEAVQVVLGATRSRCGATRSRAGRWRGGSARPRDSSTAVTGCCASQSNSRSGCELSELVRDRDVAPCVAEPDRRGDVEGALAPRLAACPASRRRRGGTMKSRRRRLTLTGSRTCGAVSGTFQNDELASGLLGKCCATRDRRDRVALAVDHEHGTPNAAAEGARLLGGQTRPVLCRRQRLAIRLERPPDGVLDRLRRVRLGEHLRHEELDEVAVVAKPVVPVVLRPTLVRVVFRIEVVYGAFRQRLAAAGEVRPDERRLRRPDPDARLPGSARAVRRARSPRSQRVGSPSHPAPRGRPPRTRARRTPRHSADGPSARFRDHRMSPRDSGARGTESASSSAESG